MSDELRLLLAQVTRQHRDLKLDIKQQFVDLKQDIKEEKFEQKEEFNKLDDRVTFLERFKWYLSGALALALLIITIVWK